MALAVVWVPELAHWHVRPPAATADQIAAAKTQPADDRLTEIAQMQLRGLVLPPDQVRPAAEAIARGELQLPGFPTLPIGLPFRPSDLVQGSPTWGLMFASLVSADVLIDGYMATGREDWFDMARQIIVAFARHESSRWLDQGLMWNDHATSARIPVLVKFWSIYRKRPDPDAETISLLMKLVARSALLLARDDAYAWRTSHGVLSDLALLQVAAAFPTLPVAEQARQTATRRLGQHIKYWINAEGMTLLHSAGYHSGSLYHLSLALRLSTLSQQPIAEDWWQRFERAIELEARLRRPDGTLPLLGDTLNLAGMQPPLVTAKGADREALALRPLVTRAAVSSSTVLPAAGLALWLDKPSADAGAATAQTVMTWAYHEGLGHKLADELSVLIWSHGQSWVTNIGYWPYGVWGRDLAESWTGSNAPHLVGEGAGSQRQSRVLFAASNDAMRFIEMERRGPQEFSASRQVLRVPSADLWLVLDHVEDALPREAEVSWTFDPALSLRPTAAGNTFVVQGQGQHGSMLASFASSTGAQPRTFRGSRDPFFGWMVVQRDPQPAASLVMRTPSQGAWSLAGFVLAPSASSAPSASDVRMRDWKDTSHWSAAWQTPRGELVISRDGDQLKLAGTVEAQLALQRAEDGRSARDEARHAFDNAARTYRRFPEVVTYREKVTAWMLGAFALQSLVLVVLQFTPWRGRRMIHVVLFAVWGAGAGWLSLVYFA